MNVATRDPRTARPPLRPNLPRKSKFPQPPRAQLPKHFPRRSHSWEAEVCQSPASSVENADFENQFPPILMGFHKYLWDSWEFQSHQKCGIPTKGGKSIVFVTRLPQTPSGDAILLHRSNSSAHRPCIGEAAVAGRRSPCVADAGRRSANNHRQRSPHEPRKLCECHNYIVKYDIYGIYRKWQSLIIGKRRATTLQYPLDGCYLPTTGAVRGPGNLGRIWRSPPIMMTYLAYPPSSKICLTKSICSTKHWIC